MSHFDAVVIMIGQLDRVFFLIYRLFELFEAWTMGLICSCCRGGLSRAGRSLGGRSLSFLPRHARGW
jgi:hypothetical protein